MVRKFYLQLLLLIFGFFSALQSFAQELKVGTRVEISYSGSWYKGSILQVKGDEYYVKYDDYSDVWNTWVKADKLRVLTTATPTAHQVGTSAFAAGAMVEYFTDNKWYPGKILEVKDNKYKFRYDEYSSVWDVWVNADRLRPRNGNGSNTGGAGNTGNLGNNGNSGTGGGNGTGSVTPATTYAAGEMVDIFSDGRWYYGKVLQVKDGKYFITYDNFSRAWDTWVTAEKLRKPAPKVHRLNATKEVEARGYGTATGFPRFKVGDKVIAKQAGNTWRYAIIKEIGKKGTIFDKQYVTVELDEYTGDEVGTRNYTWHEDVAGLVREPWWTQKYQGVWEIRIPVAMIDRTDGYKVTTTVTGGASQPPLTINANGTYSWKLSGKTITGRWIPAANHPGITVLKGDAGADWQVYLANDASTVAHFKKDIIYLQAENQTYKEGYRLK
ncbi:agenet domain-containing protein [Aridibaculum aurantiacum]|uniref:agenet domain-containing protein n=1 Tax=Aridibaculum aurantiacum TaxID=2810307 RepID=UPI001A968E43|nr:agenet domain-containing protein [Aridibaculum aurantiacum]